MPHSISLTSRFTWIYFPRRRDSLVSSTHEAQEVFAPSSFSPGVQEYFKVQEQRQEEEKRKFADFIFPGGYKEAQAECQVVPAI